MPIVPRCCLAWFTVLVLVGPGGASAVRGADPAVLTEKIAPAVLAHRPAISFGVERFNWRIRSGDDTSWAQPGLDDSTWTRLNSMYETPSGQGIFWLRFRVRSPNPALRTPTGAWISGTIAYDLYWDGTLMVRNGVPANRAEDEVPGSLDVVPTFPESLTGPGEHVVAMRVSSYRGGAPGPYALFIFFMNDPVVVKTWEMRNAILPTVAAGAMIILTVVSGAIWLFAARRPALLYLGAMSLCAATAQALIAVRWYYNYRANWYYPLETAQAYIHGILAWCFAAFVVTHFATPYRRWVLLLLAILLAVVYGINVGPDYQKSATVILVAYGVVTLPLVWAARNHRPGARPVIAGVGLSAAWILTDPWLYNWTGFFPRFVPALLGVTVAIAMQIRVERSEAQQARLTAARLEIELLKKSLQPHFLMNTLTALMEVIEQSPAQAVNLIDDLARVFRLLTAMSAERTVPLAREIELCETHLRVMSIRTGRACRLEATGTDLASAVPPALFLTLIENGFSHQSLPRDPVVFTLRQSKPRPDHNRYVFVSPGEVDAPGTRPSGGTGLKYIKARLEESSPGRWSLGQRAVATGWETEIEMGPRPAGPAP